MPAYQALAHAFRGDYSRLLSIAVDYNTFAACSLPLCYSSTLFESETTTPHAITLRLHMLWSLQSLWETWVLVQCQITYSSGYWAILLHLHASIVYLETSRQSREFDPQVDEPHLLLWFRECSKMLIEVFFQSSCMGFEPICHAFIARYCKTWTPIKSKQWLYRVRTITAESRSDWWSKSHW